MIPCPKCKAELTENDVFCFVCGHKMEQPTLSQPTEKGFDVLKPCPKCNTMPASSEDVFCAECGYKLISEVAPEPAQPIVEPSTPVADPVIDKPVEPDAVQPVVETPVAQPEPEVTPAPPIVEVVPPVNSPVPPPVVPPVIPPVAPPVTPSSPAFSQPPKKKKSAGKVIFTILLILIIVAVVGGGVFAFLIYNGSVSRQQVSFVPKSMLDMIPSASGAATDNKTASRYFVAYCSGVFDGKKEAVVSNVFNNVDIKADNDDAAEIAFRETGQKDIEKFTRFSDHFVYSFSKMGDAIEKREDIIDDLKKKGYKPQFVTVEK